jgi:hypothetical protein
MEGEEQPPAPRIRAYVLALSQRGVDMPDDAGDLSPWSAGPLMDEASGPALHAGPGPARTSLGCLARTD